MVPHWQGTATFSWFNNIWQSVHDTPLPHHMFGIACFLCLKSGFIAQNDLELLKVPKKFC